MNVLMLKKTNLITDKVELCKSIAYSKNYNKLFEYAEIYHKQLDDKATCPCVVDEFGIYYRTDIYLFSYVVDKVSRAEKLVD